MKQEKQWDTCFVMISPRSSRMRKKDLYSERAILSGKKISRYSFLWERNISMYGKKKRACSMKMKEPGSSEISAKMNIWEESEVKEGKIELTAAIDGLFKVKKEKLLAVNCLGEMMIACRHGNTPVKKGDKLAGMRVIPLVIEEEKMRKATEAAGEEPIFSIMPYKEKKVGIVTTGSEVYKGLIKDAFGPVLVEKMSEYPSRILGQKIVDDKMEHITQAVREFLDAGADLILCTGGMSVDPDDCTPGAIRNLGAEVISYGAPVLPGAMLLVAYYRNGDRVVPVVGLPGCVMYAKRTVFDLVLPRIMADDPITAKELALLGEGGLCLNCPVCTYPACGFGKGW